MRVFIIAATLLAGALIPVQTAINSQLRVALFQSPVLASLVSFAEGTIALALVYFGILRGAVPDGAMLLRTSWWMWIGGVLGAFFVMMGIVAAPRVGVATVVVALTAGLGTLGEGLGGIHRLAERDPDLDVDRDDVAARLACVAGMLVARQTQSDDPRLDGAWFRNDITQVDDQQHAISALLAATAVLEDP